MVVAYGNKKVIEGAAPDEKRWGLTEVTVREEYEPLTELRLRHKCCEGWQTAEQRLRRNQENSR